MDDINLAIWTSYEKIRIFYEKHPGLYKLRIALLLLFTVLFLGLFRHHDRRRPRHAA